MAPILYVDKRHAGFCFTGSKSAHKRMVNSERPPWRLEFFYPQLLGRKSHFKAQVVTTMQNQKIQRVLLISLPATMERGAPENDFNISHAFNLGLAYLAGVLRTNQIQVKILDCLVEDACHVRSVENNWQEVGLSDEQILERIREFAPDLIGLSIAFSYQHHMGQRLAQTIKTAFPDVLLAAGGNHITAAPEEIDRAFIDYLILGEGEYALLDLIRAINASQPVEDIPGIAPRNISTFERAPFITELDALPFPAIDLLPVEKLWGRGRRWINMVATRGCVYDCVFCSIHTIMGYKIRRRSVENVIAEIKHWYRIYKIQEIYFEDDNLTTNQKWAKELFRQIAKLNFGLRLRVRNGIRADSIDRELLQLMKAAGFQDLVIAPESGSQETLDKIIGKKMKLEDSTRAVELAREAGLHMSAFLVIGFPQETPEAIQATIEYAKTLQKLGCAGFWISLASPYPGTRLFEQCVENGYIAEDFDYRRLRTAKTTILHEYYSLEELEAIRTKVMDELSPPVLSRSEKLKSVFEVLRHDPAFFFSKIRYVWGLVQTRFVNRRILQNAEHLLAKEAG